MKNIDKIKVAIISPGYFPIPPVNGGAIESLIDLLVKENDIANKLDLTVFSMYDKSAEEIAEGYRNSKILYIKIPKIIMMFDLVFYYVVKNFLKKKKHMSYRYILQRLYYINKVSKIIWKNDFDKLIFENHPTLLLVLRKHGNEKKYTRKYYYHAHNEITNTFGNEEYLKCVTKFICVSKFIENSIRRRLYIQNANQFVVLKNCVDEEKFKVYDELLIKRFKKRYKIPDSFTVFAFTGRLNEEKGVRELLLAYKQANPPQSRLIIAGSYFFKSSMKSDYESELKAIAESIKEQVIFTGNISYDEMPLLYAAADVIVLPSIWNDPAPLTVIESLICGKPLITTCSGGILEYANSDNSIILQVDNNIVDNLSQAIMELSDPGKRMELSNNAKHESEKWTKRSYYENFTKVFIN